MLPRHLRRIVLTNATPAHIRAALTAQSALRSSSLRFRPALVSRAVSTPFIYSGTPSSVSLFHTSSRRQNEIPKSPFQTFVEVLREELKKNRELQDNVKQLQGDVDKLQDSEAMKKARAAYEHARVRRFFSFCCFLLTWNDETNNIVVFSVVNIQY